MTARYGASPLHLLAHLAAIAAGCAQLERARQRHVAA